MIRVTVSLISAIGSHRDTELARMDIANDGVATAENGRRGNYNGVTYVGRDAATLDKSRVSKRGSLVGWRRLDYHVWNMVAAMLEQMGYDKR